MQTDPYSRLCGHCVEWWTCKLTLTADWSLCGRVDMQTDPYSRLCGHRVEGLTCKLTLTADCVVIVLKG